MSSKNWAKAPGFHRERKIGRRGSYKRRALHLVETEYGESYLHATKGWRGGRTYQPAKNEAGELLLSFIGPKP